MESELQKIDYHDRTYIWENTGDLSTMYRIENKDNTQDKIPNFLNKYYSLTDFNIDALLNNYIYAAHPLELNDPFDCYSKLIDTSEVDDNDIDFIEKALNGGFNKDYILDEKVNHKDEIIKPIYDFLFESHGIISMTDSENQNPSLWANYTNSHRGFSITYKSKTLKEIAMGPFKVDYIDELIKLPFKKKQILALVLWLVNVKSKYWSTEYEWRFIGRGVDKMYIPFENYGREMELKKQNRKLYLPENAIENITLGYYFFKYDNKMLNNQNQAVVDLNKENDQELKIKLLNHIKNNNIPLSMVFLNKKELRFDSVPLKYKFIKDSNTFIFDNPL